MEPRKPHIIFYSFLSCLLVIFHVVYGGYASGITATDGIVVYDNLSDICIFVAFRCSFSSMDIWLGIMECRRIR